MLFLSQQKPAHILVVSDAKYQRLPVKSEKILSGYTYDIADLLTGFPKQ